MQTLPDAFQRYIIRELRIQRGRRQHNIISIICQALQRICFHAKGMIGTACGTGTAVNTAVAQNLSLAVAHADGLCRTQLDAGYAALTFIPLQFH